MKALLLGLLMLGNAMAQERPQLAPEQAAAFTREAWLGDWTPEPEGKRSAWPADAVLGKGQSLQAVLDALPPPTGQRRYLRIEPGVYRGAVCIRGLGPITIYGVGEPAAVRLVDGRYAGQAKAADAPSQRCVPALGANSVGTAGSASVVIAQTMCDWPASPWPTMRWTVFAPVRTTRRAPAKAAARRPWPC